MSRKNLSSQGVTRPSNTNDRFEATRKPVTERSPIGFGASQQIGSYGGYDIRASAKVDIEDLINNKLKVDIDIAQRKIDAGVNLGSEKVVGGGVGIKASIDEKGRVNIEQVSAEIGAAGFGIGASIGANSSAASASAFGVKIEIGRDETGVSAKICYSVGVGEVCTEIKPDDTREVDEEDDFDPEFPEDFESPDAQSPFEIPSGATPGKCFYVKTTNYLVDGSIERYQSPAAPYPAVISSGGLQAISDSRVEYKIQSGSTRISNGFLLPGSSSDRTDLYDTNLPNFRTFEQAFAAGNILFVSNSVTIRNITLRTGRPSTWVDYVYSRGYTGYVRRNTSEPYQKFLVAFPELEIFDCKTGKKDPTQKRTELPNPPQKYMPCNCCAEIKEIYKFLGIEKLKKHKFKVAKQFLVPGGKGTEDAEDYYAITQALFRMLANGLILNPKSKPLGSEWQNANATAWASAMYEMMAEAMSDGNSAQRFEIHAMMQLVQMMSAIAETGRKVEFIADGLGFEPELESEELPVLFTIHESHKGFGKKEPKKINVSGAKTDNEVEVILGKMLNPSKIPIVRWQFKPGEVSIKEALNG